MLPLINGKLQEQLNYFKIEENVIEEMVKNIKFGVYDKLLKEIKNFKVFSIIGN